MLPSAERTLLRLSGDASCAARLRLTPAAGTGILERMFGAVCVAQAVLLASVLLACEEDMGQGEWLIVDNRTDSLVVVIETIDATTQQQEVGETTLRRGAVDAHGRGYVGGIKFCQARALQARRDTADGPIVATRPPSDGEACLKTWVIQPD